MVQALLERLAHKEHENSLENHPTKASGHSTCDLLTFVGPLEDPQGSLRPERRLPSPDPPLPGVYFLILCAVGMSTGSISCSLDGTFLSMR
jgi:hypothetical protein